MLLLLSNKYDCQSIIVAIVWATSCSKGESRLVKQRTSSIFSMGTVPLACTWNSKGPIQNGSFPLYNLGIKKGGQYFFPSWAKYRRVSTSPYPSGQMAENKRLATYRLSCRNLLYCSLRIKKKKKKC